jgi:hypothetical protein
MSKSDTTVFHPRWVGYFAALVLLLVLIAQVESLQPLAVALAWLIALAVLVNVIDPQQGNLFNQVGL